MSNINIHELPKIKCDEPGCECDTFESAYIIRKVSALISLDGKEQIIPVMTFRCTKCKKILDYE